MKKVLRKHQCHCMLSSIFIVVLLLFGSFLNPVSAQDSVEELSGWFSIMWGDSDNESAMVYTLTDENMKRTILHLDETVVKELGGVLKFTGKFVSVEGILITLKPFISAGSVATESLPAVLNVISISLVPEPEPQASAIYGVAAAVSGSNPWVTILCKFSGNSDEPNDVAYFQGMYDDIKPGLNHYWRELSFNTADIAGSTVGGTGWYYLPQTQSYYNPTDTEKMADKDKLRQDCVAAVDPYVDFSLYTGINMMFNADFDKGWAWGDPGILMALDGDIRKWSFTWQAEEKYDDIAIFAHEMGHGFGLPHSTAPGGGVYDNPWDVMSDADYNCSASTDTTYGCMAQHTIAYYKDLLDWIPSSRKTTVPVGASTTVILEDLAIPASSNYQMVKIPIGGSITNFYTVETRRFTRYDVKLPAEGVVIHNVDSTDSSDFGPALLVPDGASTDAWTAGERFIDATNDIAVIVNADTGTGFNVTISNGNLPPTSDADGPYNTNCQGVTTDIALDGTGSTDPEGDPLSYEWTTDCTGGSFDDNTSPTATLSVDSSNGCDMSCMVSLTVTDDIGLTDVDDSTVTISDTSEPNDISCPSNITLECDQSTEPSNTGVATATDVCDPDPEITYQDIVTPGACPNEETINRYWTATDYCNNHRPCGQKQIIEVVDTTPPVIDCNAPAVIIPSDATVSFTATVTDNCDNDDPSVEITGYDCFFFTKKGKRIDRTESCIVSLEGDTINIIDSGGVGDIISWTAISTDDCANTTEVECTIDVVRKIKP